MIDLTKTNFQDLNPATAEAKAITGVKQIDNETEVKLPDGTIKRAPRGGYLVEFSDGVVKLLSDEAYERLIYG